MSPLIVGARSQQVADAAGRMLQVDGQHGTSGGDGSANYPFLTISACAAAARAHDTCLVHAGTYPEMVTVNNNDITIENVPGEPVVVTTADKVDGWTTRDGKIYTARVEAQRSIPSAHAGQSWPGDALFVNGTELAQAQFPTYSGDPLTPRWSRIRSTPISDRGGGPGTITDPALPSFTTNNYAVTVHIWSGTDPYEQYEGRVNRSEAGQLDYLPMGAGSANFAMPGGLYRVFGAPEFLSRDTWVYQRDTKQLYWMPAKDMDPNTADVRFKQRSTIFDLSGVSGVKLKGLTLVGGGVVMDGRSSGNVIDGVTVKFSSSAQRPHASAPSNKIDLYSFGVLLAGSGNLLENSVIEYTTQNGVTVHGQGNRVQNNLIHDVDTFGDGAAGIYIGDYDAPVADAVVVNNTIYRSGGAAITITSNSRYSTSPPPYSVTNLDIAYNDIRDTTMEKLDGGAIYACCRNVTSGSRVHDNWIQSDNATRTILPSGPADLLPYAGVYWDNGMGGVDIYNNVIWGSFPGIFVHGSHDSGQPTNDVYVHDNTVSDSPEPCDLMLTAINGAANVRVERNRISSNVWLKNQASGGINVSSNGPDQVSMKVTGPVGCNLRECAKLSPPINVASKPITSMCTRRIGAN